MDTELESGVEMGRPKQGAKRAAKEDATAKVAIVHLKGTQAYFEWLDAIHRKTHIGKATIFRLAMAEWAEKHGHPAPPEI